MIEVTTNRIDAENMELVITVPTDMVDKAVHKVYQQISSGQNIKGFRPGKVPRDVIKNMVGEEGIASQALQDLLPEVYENAIEQSTVVPIDEPEFDPFPTLVAGEPMSVKVKLQVLPEYEMFDYSMIPVDMKRDIIVMDTEIDEAIDHLRKNAAEFVPLVEDRGCAENDRVTLDYKIVMEGEDAPADEKKDLVVTLGDSELLPDIEKNLTGLKPGDEKQFSVPYPENYQNPDLAGKKAEISVKCNKIERRLIPEINEEFLKKAGDFADIEAFRADVKKRLTLYKHSQHEEEVKQNMIKKTLDGTHLEVPRKLVMEEIETRLDQMRGMLEQQGSSLEDWAAHQGKTIDDIQEDEYHDSRMAVKQRIVFNRIFANEKMEIARAELEMALQLYARRYNMTPTELKKMIRNRMFLMMIRDQVRETKVMRFLRSRVKFVDDPEEAVEQKLETKTDNVNIEESAAEAKAEE
ncbi:MAG: trigger factor [bacterium]